MSAPGHFRIAFFSDPHLGPLPDIKWRALANKRITGYLNWRLSRRSHHDMKALDLIIADILAIAPDHIVCGGDLANLGLPAEFVTARRLLERLGDPSRVSLVPGNHSAYVAGSVAPMLETLAPWMTGDSETKPAFPYVRRRGPVALIGLNSAAPTRPFDATGKLGDAQIEATFLLLTALRSQALCRIIVVHHPPHLGGAPRDRRLRDAADFEAMLARAGAELVLHGHNHVTSVAHRLAANRMCPVIGVGSASERNLSRGRWPVWLSIDVSRVHDSFEIDIIERGLNEKGAIVASPLARVNAPHRV
ncbi:MAG: metallophosphoesterase [Beijerinckiaceae bacterium]